MICSECERRGKGKMRRRVMKGELVGRIWEDWKWRTVYERLEEKYES